MLIVLASLSALPRTSLSGVREVSLIGAGIRFYLFSTFSTQPNFPRCVDWAAGIVPLHPQGTVLGMASLSVILIRRNEVIEDEWSDVD